MARRSVLVEVGMAIDWRRAVEKIILLCLLMSTIMLLSERPWAGQTPQARQ